MLGPQDRERAQRTAQVSPTRREAALAEIRNAEDRDHALAAIRTFADTYGAKWPKAAAKIADELDVLLAFYDFPAEHWIHLRTTNPIESTFATVRLRQRVTKGPGSRAPASPWRSSSLSRPNAAGAPSTHPTSSPSSAPAPTSTKAASSNDPTTNPTTNQEMTLKPRERSICGWPTRSAR